VLTCQQAVDFVRERLNEDAMSPAEAASALCDRCLAPDTGGCGKGCDNMSAMVVVLKRFAPAEVVEKVVRSAAAARSAGKGAPSAAGPAKKMG
jgi:serine/threonine protein phosphatase PrpC